MEFSIDFLKQSYFVHIEAPCSHCVHFNRRWPRGVLLEMVRFLLFANPVESSLINKIFIRNKNFRAVQGI